MTETQHEPPLIDLPREGTHVVGKLMPFRSLAPGDIMYVDNSVQVVTSDPYEFVDGAATMQRVNLTGGNTFSTFDETTFVLVLVPSTTGPW